VTTKAAGPSTTGAPARHSLSPREERVELLAKAQARSSRLPKGVHYVALANLQMPDGSVRRKGSLVPEANSWGRVEGYVRAGQLAVVHGTK
jgi:hypothetical protein